MKKVIHKKLHYIPGIISLVILPIVFCFFAKQKIQHLPYVIRLNWADTIQWKSEDSEYNIPHPKNYLPERTYENIVFTGNQRDDNIKLQFAQIRIREILKTNDTLNGLHFLFEDSSTYGDFVGALDKLRIENADWFLPIDNSIWFFQFAPDTAKRTYVEGLSCDDVVYMPPAIPLWKKIWIKVVPVWSGAWQIIILYGCFAAFVLIARFRR